MPRQTYMTLRQAQEILATGAQTVPQLRAHDMRTALIADDAKEPMPEIGKRKTADGKIVPITGAEPRRVRFKDSADRPVGQLRQRFTPSGQLVSLLPRPVADAWSRYLQTSHPRANPVQARAAESQFIVQLANEGKRVHALRMAGSRIADLSPQDQAIYFFASAQAAIHKVTRVRMASPTILAVCNITDYGTDAESWSDTAEGFRATLPNRSAWAGGGPGTATQQDRNLLTGRLQRSAQLWNIDQQTIARHAETVGREGGPSWDLLDQTIMDATAVVDCDAARLFAFGSSPGTAPPAATAIPGMLYLKTPTSVDISNASGEINYNTLRAWMISQFTGSNYAGGLAGDILVLAPQDYLRLSGQYVNSAGNEDDVITALLKKCPFLREVRTAREFEPLTAEVANLTAAGVPAAVAAKLGGGVNVGGVQKRAIAFFKDDPAIVTMKRGREPNVTDSGLVGGSYGGEVAANTGGTFSTLAEGVALGYQP